MIAEPATRGESIIPVGMAGATDLCSVAQNWAFLPAPGDVKLVRLTKGAFTLVDACDYERVTALGKWYLINTYAGRFRGNNESPQHIRLHRFILDAPDGVVVDHVNGDRLDNRRSNLRMVTPSQNSHNRRRVNRNSSTGCRNVARVVWRDGSVRYVVTLKVNHRSYFFGRYKTLDAANAAAIQARRQLTPGNPSNLEVAL